MVDFRAAMRRKLTTEAIAELDEWEAAAAEAKIKFANMSDETLAATAEYYETQMQPVRWAPGVPVYDATMAHFIIPELVRRVRERRRA